MENVGLSDVETYNSSLGFSHYITEHIGKTEINSWDFLSKMCNDGQEQCHMVVLDILINYNVWKEMGGEHSSIIKMEEKIYALWKYVPFPFTSITIFPLYILVSFGYVDVKETIEPSAFNSTPSP